MTDLGEITASLPPRIQNEPSLVLKISQIVRACECSGNLMVVIYLLEKKYFLYCNRAFKELIGENYSKLRSSGWDFWFTLIDREEVSYTKNIIRKYFKGQDISQPLILKYHLTDCCGNRICLKHEILVHKLHDYALALNYFFDISDKEKIEDCFQSRVDGRVGNANDQHKYSISAREKEVLQLISEGYSSKQIANLLFISNHTAISHRKNLIEKFQVKNTAHLVKRALEFMLV